MFLMGMMLAGVRAVDAITSHMMPLTAKHFTSDLALIGALLATTRITGFLVQPYAAWKGDRHSGPNGRRRPFLLAAIPATLVCVGLLGALPFIVPAAYQSTAAIVCLLFLVNLAMQVGVDVCYGNATPLYGDTFPQGTLGRANGVRRAIGSLVMIIMMSFAMPLAGSMEFLPFLFAMGFLAVSWAVTRYAIREKMPVSLPQGTRYHPLLPLSELRNAQTRNVAAIASAAMIAFAVTEMFHALFVMETLDLSFSALGWTTTVGVIVSLACPYPVGFLVDRLGPRSVLLAGFLMMLGVATTFLFWVDGLISLILALILYRIARVVIQVPMVALMFQNTPPERRGSIFAGVQMTRAALASGATLVAGYLAQATGSYRICYAIAGVACIAGFLWAVRFRSEKRPMGSEASQA